MDQKGNDEGFDIDFSRELAKKLDQKLVIKDCGSMPGLILALEQGKIDLIIWAVSITEERSKKMEMVYYQGEKIDQMLLWKFGTENQLQLWLIHHSFTKSLLSIPKSK